MLSIQNISIHFAGHQILDQANLSIYPNSKVGLIGQNGAGKSTLFKAILNQVPIATGNIHIPKDWVIGHMVQELSDIEGATNQSALDFVSYGDFRYAQICHHIEEAEQEHDHDALVKAHDEMDKISGYHIPQISKQLLYGLGFSESEFEKPVSAFSGGWQVRLKLARSLMMPADILLLDEPTNHLDIEAVSWFIQWIKQYQGAVLVISHDRDFLDQVVGSIAHIEHHKIQTYSGNFASFEKQRNAKLMQQQALHEKQKQQMQHLKTFITRFKAKASKAKQAQSRVKALSRMEEVAAVQATNPFHFEFLKPEHQPDPLLNIESVSFRYSNESRYILDQVDLTLRAGDRIGLVGVNGSGKSTLLKLIVGENKSEVGKLVFSKNVKIGYFAQHQLDLLDADRTPVNHLMSITDNQITDQESRDYLGRFGFGQEQALANVGNFSGGEKARLVLALLVYQKPNLLILDEPTNHLDMEMRDALDIALQTYEGAVILVSHDKHMLTSIVDQFWWVHEGRVERGLESLDDYLSARLKAIKALNAQNAKDSSRDDNTTQITSESTRPDGFNAEKGVAPQHTGQVEAGQLNKKEQRQKNAQIRKALDVLIKPLEKKSKQLEKKLETLQVTQAELNTLMAAPEIYEDQNKNKLTDAIKHLAAIESEIETLEAEWLSLEDEIETKKESFFAENEL